MPPRAWSNRHWPASRRGAWTLPRLEPCIQTCAAMRPPGQPAKHDYSREQPQSHCPTAIIKIDAGETRRKRDERAEKPAAVSLHSLFVKSHSWFESSAKAFNRVTPKLSLINFGFSAVSNL